ncbi:MAG: methionyl-tRNA formyltransferase [Nitrospirae bacterium]|nr:methionyl-tRNA formyltransferase [Nitrospirota bacterium]
MGTPSLSVPFLDAIIKSGRDVVYAVTQTDKQKGRGQKLVASPVKEFALSHGIPVLQPKKLSDSSFSEAIRASSPDYIVVVAYGRIIPLEILQIPKKNPVNVHASLLPEYRGASPIQRAIMDGRSFTGVTTMVMFPELDAGDILLQERIEIDRCDTSGSLGIKMTKTGPGLLIRTLDGLDRGEVVPVPQEHDKASYAPIIRKEEGLIDWKDSAENIYNRIRAFDPWPGAFTFYNGKRWGVWKADIVDRHVQSSVNGEIIEAGPQGIVIVTGDRALKITELQAEGKKRMPAGEYLRGHNVEKGAILKGI